MKYIDVAWRSPDANDPHRLVSELDDQRLETRKLEFFRSGVVGSASSSHETANTALGTVAIPELQEINVDPQFSGRELSPAEFDDLWSQHGRSLALHEVVQLLASVAGLPQHLVGTQAVVLLAHEGTRSPVYEIECVAVGGSTVWQGALPRESLRGQQRNDA